MYDFITELGKIDVEYAGESDDSFSFKSYVKSVEPDFILIDFLFYRGAEYNIPDGKIITVRFKQKSGIYTGNCYIIGRDNSHLSGIKISYPFNIKFIQQREYVRVPLKLNVELVIFPENEGEDVKVEEIKTQDISGSGFYFVSDKPIEKHSKIIGFLNLSNSNEKPIEILLKHVYSRIFNANGKDLYKTAFTFAEINEKSREKILKEVFLYELEMRKKGL